MRHRVLQVLIACVLFSVQAHSAEQEATSNPDLLAFLARDFFAWRSIQQPVSGDDIPRVERPQGWVPDVSPEALELYREKYRAYRDALDRFDTEGWSVSQQVDARLLDAAIERVYWELDILKSPRRNPLFYVQQTAEETHKFKL